MVGLDTYTRGTKDFHKCWTGSLAKRRLPRTRRRNKLHSTTCNVLQSEFVSQNVKLQQNKSTDGDNKPQSNAASSGPSLHVKRESPFVFTGIFPLGKRLVVCVRVLTGMALSRVDEAGSAFRIRTLTAG